jgi:hypothetical protein
MPIRTVHPAGRFAVRMIGTLGLGACAVFSRTGQASQPPRSLVINNRTGYEVVVYAVPAPGAVGTRLGTAASFGTTTIKVAQSALQNGTDMVVRLHALGQATSAQDWVSPRVSLNNDLVARLDVRADSYGSLSGSTFYTSPPASIDIH